MRISSRWQKQNTFIRNTGFAISLVSAALLAIIFVSLGLERQGAVFSILAALLGFVATLILSNRKPKVMVRILRVDYEEIERDFRILFKENFIRFIKRVQDDSYRYEFPGYRLSMTVQPYAPQQYSAGRPTTEIILGELNGKNEAFAQKLAGLIDEMVTRRAAGVDEG